MAKKIIQMSLSSSSIQNAIKELDNYKRELLNKEKILLEKLRDIGVGEASVRFTTAAYDGVNDVSVTYSPADKGYAIMAKGQAVAFIEFGTGVYYNSGEPYPIPRPEGIVGIGEYGKRRGQGRAWFYQGDAGTNGIPQDGGLVKTRGNPAAMPMWYASEEMRKSILKIAREVFG